jgi:hypothetical protein
MVLVNQTDGYSSVKRWPSVGGVGFYPIDDKQLKILRLRKHPDFIGQIEQAVTYQHRVDYRASSIVLDNDSIAVTPAVDPAEVAKAVEAANAARAAVAAAEASAKSGEATDDIQIHDPVLLKKTQGYLSRWDNRIRPNDKLSGLIESGHIRVASSEDIVQLAPFVKGGKLMYFAGISNCYVIEKHVSLPEGLYGEYSSVFIVPEGVPMPKGELVHSLIYDLNTMRCHGNRCRR